MNKREFTKLLNKITTQKILDVEKIPSLTDDERSKMVYFIIRNRLPVVKELIPEGFDLSWLHSMGYMQETKGKKSGYTFIHNSEQAIK
jgi:hypothetical protein